MGYDGIKSDSGADSDLAKVGETIKLIRFGQQGVSGAGKNPMTLAKERCW